MSMSLSGPELVGNSRSRGRPAWLHYGAAVALPALTLVIRLAFWDYVPGLPFITFIPTVALLAAVGGVGPAALAAILSAPLGLIYLSVPSAFGPGNIPIWIGFAAYVTVCTILLVFTHRMTKVTAQKLRAEEERSDAREAALRARLDAAEAVAAQGQAERRLE